MHSHIKIIRNATFLHLCGYTPRRMSSWSKNVRTELRKAKKIYFYDNGVRNSILGNYKPLALRADTGVLWENFLIAERMKVNAYSSRRCASYFWRTTQQQEIDYIEEIEGKLHAYEFKWGDGHRAKCPKTFDNNYAESTFTVVTPQNYLTFLADSEMMP